MRTEHIKPSRSQPEMVKGKDWKKKGGQQREKYLSSPKVLGLSPMSLGFNVKRERSRNAG